MIRCIPRWGQSFGWLGLAVGKPQDGSLCVWGVASGSVGFFAATRARLREVAQSLGMHRLVNLAGCAAR